MTALSQTDVMVGLKTAVKSCQEVVGTACDALAAIFNSTVNTDKLVLQVCIVVKREHNLKYGFYKKS